VYRGDDNRRRNAYLWDMGKVTIVIALLALLIASLWFAARSFMLDGPDMPAEGYVAMGFGIVFSLIVGIGLMALVFYSSRRGYDEPAELEDTERWKRDR
jgi:hypothetical protein